MKAIRGAITIEENTVEAIKDNSILMLQELVQANNLLPEDIVQVTFTATKDINKAYPAKFAREIGWHNVPLICLQEMDVEGSLAMCIRVVLLVEKADLAQVKHVYLKGAKVLRPDLVD